MTIIKQISLLLLLLPAISCHKQNRAGSSNLTVIDAGMQVSFTVISQGDTSRILLSAGAGYQKSDDLYYTISASDTNYSNLLYIELFIGALDSGALIRPGNYKNFELATYGGQGDYYVHLQSIDYVAPGVTVIITSFKNGVIAGTFSGSAYDIRRSTNVIIQDGKFQNLAPGFLPNYNNLSW
jgi:hypothetical protein